MGRSRISLFSIVGARANKILSHLEFAYGLNGDLGATMKQRIERINTAMEYNPGLQAGSCATHDWGEALFVDSNHNRPDEHIRFCLNCGCINE